MKKSLKKNCERCRCIEPGGRCGLGYNNRGEFIKTLGAYRIQPQEPCPKPLTIAEMFQAENSRQQLADAFIESPGR